MGQGRIRPLALAAALGSMMLACDAWAQLVGHTPGEFSVDAAGAATYRIPLQLPAGAAGMQPELALLYHSRAGNGQLGVGWSVSGLSVINRCAALRDSEGVAYSDGVTLSATDRFCLDGQPLRHQSGTYGGNGTLYFTEVQSFQYVRSYGPSGGPPTRFEVTDRAGLKRHYGQTADSRILSVGGTSGVPLVWALNRIEDKHGNFISFSYGGDTELGEYWPSEIRWSNNLAQVLGRVVFSYTTARPDKTYGYSYGRIRQSLTRRLSNLQVYEGTSTAIRKYSLSYQQGTVNQLSHLSAVQECAATGSPCLPATTFQWQHGTQGLILAPTPVAATSSASIKWLDLNGDGRMDAVLKSGSNIMIYLASNNGSGLVQGSLPAGSNLPLEYAVPLDYNGDGLTDLLVPNTSSGNWDLYRSTGFGLVYEQTGRPHYGAHTRNPAAFDITGNGVPELFFKWQGKILVYRGADGGGFVASPVTTMWTVSDGQKFMPVEYDGDGRPELLVTFDGCTYGSGGGGGGGGGPGDPGEPIEPYGGAGGQPEPIGGMTGIQNTSSSDSCAATAGAPLKWNAAGNSLYRPSTFGSYGGLRQAIPLDMDGDGLTDIVSIDIVTGKPAVLLNRGATWQKVWTGLSSSGWDKSVVHDWNLDGKDDLLVPGTNGQFLALSYRSNTLETLVTGLSSGQAAYTSGDWTGNGLTDLLYRSGSYWYVWRQRGLKPGLLTRVRNGLGDELAIAYASLSSGPVGSQSLYMGHEAGDAATSTPRVRNFRAPVYVVESYAADAGINHSSGTPQKVLTKYRYAGAKLNQHGRGFLGFRRVLAHNLNTDTVTENVHLQDFPYTGMLAQSVRRLPNTTSVQAINWSAWSAWFSENCGYSFEEYCSAPSTTVTVPGPVIGDSVNTVAFKLLGTSGAGRVRFPYIATSTERSFEFSGSSSAVVKRTITQHSYDNNGNITGVTTAVDNGAGGDLHTLTTSNVYSHTEACPSRLTRSTVTQVASATGGHGALSQQRIADFAYAPGHCQLTSETSNAGTSAALTRSYGYDSFGNRTIETVTGAGISPARISTTAYDARGRYPIQVTNPMGHQESTTWHQGLGVRLTTTDANGLVTSWQHDALGRETRVTAPRSTQFTTTGWAWCGSGSCQHPEAVLKVTRTGSGGTTEQAQSVTEIDRLGREVATGERNVQGQMAFTLTFYDPAGRPYASSGPYRPGVDGGACWTIRHYDPLGRVKKEYSAALPGHCTSLAAPPPAAAPSGWSRTQTDYFGLTTRVTDPEGRQREQTVNVMGRLRFAREHDGGTWRQTEYRYDAVGNATRVQDPGGAVTISQFDVAGRKTEMADPNMGTWRYLYNAAGELSSQTDAKGVTTTMTYDALGRIKTRSEPEGTTTFTYDNTANGPAKGKLTNIAGPNNYQERYWYHASGELRFSARYLGDAWYWTHFDYNALGQVSRIRYPSVNCANPCSSVPADESRLRVDQYFRYGHLYLVRERKPDNTIGTTYWQALEVDALGSISRERLGNGLYTLRYVNPANGRLESLLTGTTSNPTAVQDLAMAWDRVGHLLRRTDHRTNRREDLFYDGLGRLDQVALKTAGGSALGTENVLYGPSGNLLAKSGYTSYQYHANRPNAVSSVTTPAGPRSYAYDANGNLTSVTGAGARSVSWWSFNKPRRLERDGNNYSEFWYGPGNDRPVFRQSAHINGQIELTLYGGALYERRIVGATVEHNHYIQANGATVATVRRSGTSTTNTTRYLHRDHLGSVVAITNESAAMSESLAYDAWGKRRPPTTWQSPTAGVFLSAAWQRRGFTMHEHMDHVGLIHMGGRVYDPEIGRFLSPDPFVQFPASTQGFNRYSYAGNNPLSFTDPSGYFLKSIGRALGVAMMVVPGMQLNNIWLHGFLSGFLAGAGNLRTGLMGMMSAGVANQVGGLADTAGLGNLGRATLHGVTQGAIARAGGGRFGDGALGAFSGSILSFIPEAVAGPYGSGGEAAKIGRMLAAAAVGGTASKLGGGKFANGAWSAAFVSRFNHDGIGREPMKNPLRMLWEGFKMRFMGIEPGNAEVSGIHDSTRDVLTNARELADAGYELASNSFLTGGVCAGAGPAGCFETSVSLRGVDWYSGYGKGYGVRPYVGVTFDPVEHHGVVSRTYVSGGHLQGTLSVSQAGISPSATISLLPAPFFVGSTLGFTIPLVRWHGE